uniref:NIDO domain-containing protein n=1 Tax=Amphimedon queenslandica TaxID=400682 RepID=A0A1X7THC2_AMPQE
MIVFVILIYFNILLVSSEGNYLPFLHPTDYSILDDDLDWAVNVPLPSPLRFGSSCHTEAWISTHGLISLGTSFTEYRPDSFPIITPVIAAFWDDNDLTGRGEARYAIVTPTTNLSLCNQVNNYLSTSTGSSVSVEWILWVYWYDLCPYGDRYCNYTESNHFQVVLAYQSNATYAVFIYKCGLIEWTEYGAGVGINSGSGYYINHPLSNTGNVTDIDCYDAVSGWTNIVYRLDQDQFEFLSITPDSITVSWELSNPNINSTLILSITDSLQTVNETINVTEYNNVYNYTEDLSSCNGYTFKLALPMSSECKDSISISTALTPKPDNVSALYLTNETIIMRFQIHQFFINNIKLLLVGANTFNTSDLMGNDSLQYIDEFYIIHWNIKLNDHSLYYLTVSTIGTYGTSTSDHVIEINTYNVKDIIIERNEDIVCFICVTEMLNECQLMITTLIPQSIQTNGTCYSFTDNGTYTVYAHDIENGIKILTPAIVIEYTVDWIEPSDAVNVTFSSTEEFIMYKTSSKGLILSMYSPVILITTTTTVITTTTTNIGHQSQSQIILGVLLGLTTLAVLILSLAMIVILRKKGKAKSENSIPHTQEISYENQVATKEDPTYEMISNEIPSINTNNYTSLTITTTDN